jgi:peroxiredoxin Q/BCP
MLQTGNIAPNFNLKNQDGKNIELYQELEKGPVVIFFYPKDNSLGCTAEACAFRDHYEDFTNKGIEVMGISNDGQEAHQGFAQQHKLPFPLLTDEKGETRKAYKVKNTLWIIPGRVTFVIGTDKKIIHVFNSQANVTKHVKEALKSLGVSE